MSRAEREAAAREAALDRGIAAGKSHGEAMSEPWRRQERAATERAAFDARQKSEREAFRERTTPANPNGF